MTKRTSQQTTNKAVNPDGRGIRKPTTRRIKQAPRPNLALGPCVTMFVSGLTLEQSSEQRKTKSSETMDRSSFNKKDIGLCQSFSTMEQAMTSVKNQSCNACPLEAESESNLLVCDELPIISLEASPNIIDFHLKLAEKPLQIYTVNADCLASMQCGEINEVYRLQVLDWLQECCAYMGFQRQTYYLAKEYLDMALTHGKQILNELQLLGVTALLMAMKVEQIELKHIYEFSMLTKGSFTTKDIARKERQMLTMFKWQINPTTLDFYLMAFCQLWDKYVAHSDFVAVPRFRTGQETTILNLLTHPFVCFSLKEPNWLRRVSQAMDLISLDLQYAQFQNSRLALAVILVAVLICTGSLELKQLSALSLTRQDVEGCQQQLATALQGLPLEHTNVYHIIEGFLQVSNLRQENLVSEMTYAAPFYLLHTEFAEPVKVLSQFDNGATVEVAGVTMQPWLTREEYLSVHTYTCSGFDFVSRLLSLRK